MAYITKKTTVNGVKPIGSNLFGTCSTASDAVQKVVAMADFDVLVSGVTIHVQFTHKNTASNPTLKVGSTSAVAILCNGATEGNWEDGAVISFTYNGTNWIQNDASEGGGATYTLSKNGDTITLTGSDGSTSSVTDSDTILKYTADAPDGATTNNVVQNDVANNVASGGYSLAEGIGTTASGLYSHAEGQGTTASGDRSHAEGFYTVASGNRSFAGNNYTISQRADQTVIGRMNIADTQGADGGELGKYAFIIGNGNADDDRSNGFTVDWQGRVECGDYSGAFKSLFDIFYPVGSYYETSDSSFNPNTVWGGTWVLETAGQVHVSAGTGYSIGSTGGSTTHYHSTGNHTLTVNQIPSHTHPIAQRSGSGMQFSGWHYEFTVNNSSGPVWNQNTTVNRSTSAIGYTGGGQAHNHGNTGDGSNMQPYVVVNRWHRTA